MKISKIAVIGAGTMGKGIAQWFCQQNVQVHLVDIDQDFLKKSIQSLKDSWDKLEQKGKFTNKEVKSFKENIVSKNLDNLDQDYQLVIEAVVEDFDVKKNLFEKLDKHLNKDAILASNTSSFPIASMAKHLSEERKVNFLGLHFFNPATIMKLVEIIKGPWTKPEHMNELYAWFDQRGKKPAKCNDSPGFIVNRVARNFYGEALRIVKTHDQDKIKEVDDILKKVGGFRMGPFELMDLIGVDINYNVSVSVWKSYFYEPRFAPHTLQKQMVDSGRLGRKTKEGFYNYES